jgi:hypothetical protein
MLKKDNLLMGIILGTLAPVLGVVGFYFYKFSRLNFIEFIQYISIEKRLLTSMISFSLLANAAIFTIYVNAQKDKTGRGIFIVTLIYAIVAIILKLVY